jgi:hypothetical protein
MNGEFSSPEESLPRLFYLSGAANPSASNLDGPAAFLALGSVLLDRRCAVGPPTDVAH